MIDNDLFYDRDDGDNIYDEKALNKLLKDKEKIEQTKQDFKTALAKLKPDHLLSLNNAKTLSKLFNIPFVLKEDKIIKKKTNTSIYHKEEYVPLSIVYDKKEDKSYVHKYYGAVGGLSSISILLTSKSTIDLIDELNA